MNRALLAFVLRRHRFALIACWVVPVLIALAVGLIYPTYAKEREAIERLTKFFGQFFGGDVIDLLSPKGFLTLPFQHPLTLLMLAISAAAAPLALPAGDRGRGALDMLLATRLSRSSLGRTVFAAVALAAVTFGWAPFLGVWIAASVSGYSHEIPFGACALIALNAGALVLALGTAALLCSAISDDGGSATSRFVGFVVVTLATDVLARFWKAGKWLRWTNLLGYYRPPDILADPSSVWLSIAVLLAFSAVAYVAADRVLVNRRRA